MADAPAVPSDHVRRNFDNQGIMRLLGARLVRVEPGLAEIELAWRPELGQQDGLFHAGVLTTIVDSAGGYAAFTLRPDAATALTVEYKINFLAPARGQRILARGRCLRSGRTVSVCELEVESEEDGKRVLCARGLQTLVLPAKSPSKGTPAKAP